MSQTKYKIPLTSIATNDKVYLPLDTTRKGEIRNERLVRKKSQRL